VFVGVSAFCLLAMSNAPDSDAASTSVTAEELAVEQAVQPEAAPTWSDAIAPADDDDDGCQVSVQATLDDRPADSARFALHRVGASSTEATWTASPRADGVHRFAGLPHGTYHLVAEHLGRAPVAAPPWTCAGDGERAFFALDFDKIGAPLTGRVTGRGGELAEGTEIMIEQPDGFRGAFGGIVHLSLDDEGTFATRLAPGRYTLLALAPHHTPITQELTITEHGGQTRLRMQWRPEARGFVYDDAGAPVAGATVFLGPHFDPRVPPSMTTTEDDGSFELAVLPGRDILLTAKTDVGVGHVRLGEVTQLRGHTGVSIQLKAGRTVSGWIEQRDGRPVAFGEVTYRIKELGLVGVVKAKDDGTFALAGVPLAADVELWPKDGAIGAWGGAVASPGRDRVLLTYVPPAY
jgi:hypothetical protein